MPSDRKSHDIVLPEVRKPAGYGTLVAVVVTEDGKRELWFQHPEDPAIVRAIEIDLDSGQTGRAHTLKTRGERNK